MEVLLHSSRSVVEFLLWLSPTIKWPDRAHERVHGQRTLMSGSINSHHLEHPPALGEGKPELLGNHGSQDLPFHGGHRLQSPLFDYQEKEAAVPSYANARECGGRYMHPFSAHPSAPSSKDLPL